MDNSKYSFASPRRQQFSLPLDVISYLLKNCPSPKIFQKLQKTCKTIFSKKKIIVLDAYVRCTDSGYFNYYASMTKTIIYLKENFQYWFCSELVIAKTLPGPTYFHYMYRCDLNTLNIYYEPLTFKEISFLLNGGNVEKLILYRVEIKYEDGTSVTIDAIMKQCPKLNYLTYKNLCETFSNETFEKLLEIKMVQKLKDFRLYISQINCKIDSCIFTEFLKKYFDGIAIGQKVLFKCVFDEFDNFKKEVENNLRFHCAKNVMLFNFI